MTDMDTKQIINTLLIKETEITNRIHHTIAEIMRLGYETERGKKEIPALVDSIEYILEDLAKIQ